MEKIKVMLVDDQPLFAQSLKTFLENYATDIVVVGLAENGSKAVELALELAKTSGAPDMVLMDVHMPIMNGVEATKRLRSYLPNTKIIMLSTYDEDEYVRDALKEGASGYLLKDISPTELIAAIRALRGGVMQISPQIAAKLVHQLYDDTKPKVDSISKKFEWFNTLTKREREIFTLIATGLDNEGIAKKLNIAEQTVRNHVSVIYSKLGVKDRFEIIQLANEIRYHN
ncbi:response regulator [Gracilinema caldarium]|uniref:Two component transcriptional regulator, LuxR family n=1 Tax=Gracilinema caldarium (strain ATCC 51460 / DSM 7334 / H1) TaxID=744872 RepID=F8EWT2_GRAC1|nr:response regulator transcription factor [Gracilinema caldarium]AEJ18318.1 two component transcriptional regulator, LuxR family [Gracilinema caldarium DSM 7334]